MTRSERWIALAAPCLAALAVVVGLRAGAPPRIEAAVVQAAPPAAAARGMPLPVRAFAVADREESPLVGVPVRVRGTRSGDDGVWTGATNGEGVAEAWLPLPSLAGVELEVRSGDGLLARGPARAPGDIATLRPDPVWMPFARRQGPLRMAVAVVGQRVAPGVAAIVCVRVDDDRTGRPAPRVRVAMDPDPSWMDGPTGGATDGAGWTQWSATPVGLATSLALHARGPDGASGEWSGGVYVDPGAPRLETRARWAEGDAPELVVSPPVRPATEYVEIDDAQGRAWTTAIDFDVESASAPRAKAVRAPALPPGLYWAAASRDPSGPGPSWRATAVRPFFVAADDGAALAFGTDRDVCSSDDDPRLRPATLWPCLAAAAFRPPARWIAVDGVPAQRARVAERRRRGLVVAVGAVVTAALLELVVLLRTVATARTRILDDDAPTAAPATRGRARGGDAGRSLARLTGVTAALLVALLGFALLAAFLLRVD